MAPRVSAQHFLSFLVLHLDAKVFLGTPRLVLWGEEPSLRFLPPVSLVLCLCVSKQAGPGQNL